MAQEPRSGRLDRVTGESRDPADLASRSAAERRDLAARIADLAERLRAGDASRSSDVELRESIRLAGRDMVELFSGSQGRDGRDVPVDDPGDRARR